MAGRIAHLKYTKKLRFVNKKNEYGRKYIYITATNMEIPCDL
jgi:hypothetical protein